MQSIDTNRSLSEHCGTSFKVPQSGHVTGLMKRVEEISLKKIKDLSHEEIQVALSQSICLDVLIPYVIPLIIKEPEVGGLFPGGLLHSLLKTLKKPWNMNFWIENNLLRLEVCQFIVNHNLIERINLSQIDSDTKEEINELYAEWSSM